MNRHAYGANGIAGRRSHLRPVATGYCAYSVARATPEQAVLQRRNRNACDFTQQHLARAPCHRLRPPWPAQRIRNTLPGPASMHIEESVKLDFKDVLIRPKRSTLTSRSEVDIQREFSFPPFAPSATAAFPSSPPTWTAPAPWKWRARWATMACRRRLHKHYPEARTGARFSSRCSTTAGRQSTAFYSMGISKSDYEKFEAVMAQQRHGDRTMSASTSPTAIPKASSISSRRCAAIIRT